MTRYCDSRAAALDAVACLVAPRHINAQWPCRLLASSHYHPPPPHHLPPLPSRAQRPWPMAAVGHTHGLPLPTADHAHRRQPPPTRTTSPPAGDAPRHHVTNSARKPAPQRTQRPSGAPASSGRQRNGRLQAHNEVHNEHRERRRRDAEGVGGTGRQERRSGRRTHRRARCPRYVPRRSPPFVLTTLCQRHLTARPAARPLGQTLAHSATSPCRRCVSAPPQTSSMPPRHTAADEPDAVTSAHHRRVRITTLSPHSVW
jgi:hypothetical protein